MTPTRTPDALDVPIPAELIADPPVSVDALLALHDIAARQGVDIGDLVDEEGNPADDLVVPSALREAALWARSGPGDDAVVEWLGRLLAGAKTQKRGAQEQAAVWRESIDAWERTNTAEPDRIIAVVTPLLEEYAVGERLVGGRATIALPSVTIRTTAQNAGGRADVEDKAKVIEWAEGLPTVDYEAVVKTERSIVLGEWRKRVRVVKTGEGLDIEWQVVDEGGAIVPGAKVTPPSYSPKVG